MAKEKKKKGINLNMLEIIIVSSYFVSLDDNLKKNDLKDLRGIIENESKKSTGIMGRLFGNCSKNISLYIALIIAVLLIIVGLIYIFLPLEYKQTTNLEFWQIISTIITGVLGYIFGSISKK